MSLTSLLLSARIHSEGGRDPDIGFGLLAFTVSGHHVSMLGHSYCEGCDRLPKRLVFSWSFLALKRVDSFGPAHPSSKETRTTLSHTLRKGCDDDCDCCL